MEHLFDKYQIRVTYASRFCGHLLYAKTATIGKKITRPLERTAVVP